MQYYNSHERYPLIYFLVFTLAVFVAFDGLSFYFKRSGWARFASTFFFSIFFIVLSQFVLGMLSLLTRQNLIFLNIVFAAAAVLVGYRFVNSAFIKQYLHGYRRAFKDTWKEIKTDYPFLFLLFLSAVILGWIIFLGLVSPVTDFDGNSYHMSAVAYAIQQANLFDPQTSLSWLAGYPKGGEIMQLWSVILLGKDTLADLFQIPFLIAGVYALYALAVNLGVSKNNARFAAWLFLFTPVVINQLKTTYLDVLLASLFFAALALTVRVRPGRLDLLVLGIVFSLLISIKSSGFIFIAAIAPFLAYGIVDLKNKRPQLHLKAYAYKIALVLIPLFFGAYWYVKNYIKYGSPVYPFGLEVAGNTIFPGQTFQDFIAHAFTGITSVPAGMFQRIWFTWTEQKDWFGCLYNYDATFSGLGPIWLVLLLPAIPFALYIAWRIKNYAFMMLTLIVAALFVVYPANFYTRYVLFIFAPGLVAIGLLLSVQKAVLVNAVKIFALYLSVVVIGYTFTLCNYTPVYVRQQYNAARTGNDRSSIIYGNAVGPAYMLIQNTVQPGEVVAYDSKPYFIYPLWKPDLSNKVLYVTGSSQNDWEQNLKKTNVAYVFTNTDSKEHEWANNSQFVKSIYKDGFYEIFKTQK